MARKVIGIAKNVAGPPGSRRRRWAMLVSLAIILGAGVVFMQTVLAVKDAGAIELDGDANQGIFTVPTGTNGVDDWDNVCFQAVQKPIADGGLGLDPVAAAAKCGTSLPTSGGSSGAAAVSWVEEPNPATTIFTGGGSKDPQDVSAWLWKDDQNNPPDKDNIEHAYAARYKILSPTENPNCPNGTTGANYNPDIPCDVLYFGLDRFDNSGDANTGFWFFQNKISLTNPPVSSQGGFLFEGLHTPGDVLVISGFSNGGGTSTITVFKWDPFCAADGKNENPPNPNPPGNSDPDCKADNLRQVANLTGAVANCLTSVPIGGQGCGIVNPLPASGVVTEPSIFMPWTFLDKSGTPGNGALNGEFYEAGINLTLLGLNEGCFQTVLSNSRTSTSPTSVLKDFVLGGFGKCETTLTTTASLHATGTTIIAGNGAGSGTASSGSDTAALTIDGITTWSGTLDFHLCGPLASVNDVCSSNGVLVTTRTVSNSSAANDFISGLATLTSAGRYCWFAKFTPDAATLARGVTGAEHAGTPGTDNLECFTVLPVIPILDTQAVASPVLLGSPIEDTATLANLAREPGSNGLDTDFPTINATNGLFAGAITFVLRGPNTCATSPSGFVPIVVNVNSLLGNAVYGGAGVVSFTPTAPGTYSWQAEYRNNAAINNQATVTHNPTCTDVDENVVVEQPTQIATAPFAFPQDTARIRVTTGNLPLGGTVVFALFPSLASCQANAGGAVYTETKNNVVTVATNEVTGITTNNTTFQVTSANGTTFYWRVTYTPGGTTTTGRQSSCVENTVITHTDAAYPGTPIS